MQPHTRAEHRAYPEQTFATEQLPELFPTYTHASYPIAFVSEMAQAEDFSETLDCITFWMQQLFVTARASIVLEDGNGMLSVWALRGTGASQMDKSVPIHRGRLGRAVRNKQLILSCDLADCDEADGKKLYEAGLRRSINAPLIVARRCIGAINIGFETPEQATPEMACDLQMLANWIAPKLHSQREYLNKTREVKDAEAARNRALGESRAKTSFIANISHEIRTPLNGILGMAQVLVEDLQNADHRSMAEVIVSSGSSLLNILNDLIDVSRIDSGEMPITPVRNSPRRILTQAATLWRNQAAAAGLFLELRLPEDMPECIVFDACRVEQCLANLISNAIKFTNTGGVLVTASFQKSGDRVMTSIDIEDTGPGIPEHEQELLFQRFRQSDQALLNQTQGSGLGLSISRKLARLMGGDVVVKSTVGKGSIFTLSFEGRHADSRTNTEATEATSKTPSSNAFTLAGKAVLVVEDIATNRIVIEMMLKKLGADVQQAENGRDAMAKLEGTRFDLVLLDMNMPVMDGAETISAIRQSNSETCDLPVIALTADALQGDRERYLSMGLNGYVAKPVNIEALTAEMSRLLEG